MGRRPCGVLRTRLIPVSSTLASVPTARDPTGRVQPPRQNVRKIFFVVMLFFISFFIKKRFHFIVVPFVLFLFSLNYLPLRNIVRPGVFAVVSIASFFIILSGNYYPQREFSNWFVLSVCLFSVLQQSPVDTPAPSGHTPSFSFKLSSVET